MQILILGGTGEAKLLAEELRGAGHATITSLAGRTSNPTRVGGEMVVGGFGGADGLADFLKSRKIDFLIDATHPYAVQISRNAVDAAATAKVDLLRLNRAPWAEPKDAGWWHVADEEEAAKRLPGGASVFLSIGRQKIEPFLARPDCHFVARTIEMPDIELPANFLLVRDHPEMDWKLEAPLLQRNRVTHMVTKNAGGEATYAKIEAAYVLKVQVVMIDRPALPEAPEVETISAVIDHVASLPPPRKRFLFFP